MKNETVSIKDFKQALSAHNAGREAACFNDNYNVMNKLGTFSARSIVNRIASHHYGCASRGKKLTSKHVIEWSKGMMEPGSSGYPSQIIEEYMREVVNHYKAM